MESASYVERLIAFHEALRHAAPPGFRASATFRAGRAPWVSSDESFEDWYVTDGSASLDPLNDASVSGNAAPARCRRALRGRWHGGLYRLRLGSADVARAGGRWFAKPAGMTYPDFYASLDPLAGRLARSVGASDDLGPTPEFCLMSPEPTALPEGLDAWPDP